MHAIVPFGAVLRNITGRVLVRNENIGSKKNCLQGSNDQHELAKCEQDTYPSKNENVVVVPQPVTTSDFAPQAKAKKDSCASEQRPEPCVQLLLGIDIVDDMLSSIILLARSQPHRRRCGSCAQVAGIQSTT